MHTTRTRSRPFKEQRKVSRADALLPREIEDFILSEIAKRGGKALAPGEPMLINAQKSRAGPILELRVLMQDHLVIEPLGRSHGNPLQLSDMLIGNTFIIL